MGAIGLATEFWPRRAPNGTVFDLGGNALPPGARFARASAATRVDAHGHLVVEPADAPRFDHGPLSGGARGILIEPQRTNLLPAGFSASHATLAAGQADIIGGTSGYVLTTTADAGSAAHFAGAGNVGGVVGATYWSSCFAKAVSHGLVQVVTGGSVSAAYANFDLVAGAVIASGGGGTGIIEPAGGGWFRIGLGFAAVSTVEGTGIAVATIADGAATRLPTYTTGSDQAVALCFPQCEAGGSMGSYIPTTTMPATRSADVLTLDWASRGVGDGAITVRYTFDDGSTQDAAATVSGGKAIIPTTLARPRIMRAEKR